MAVEIAMPTLATVLATAAIDSINPCAIGVLILLVSTLLVNKKKGDMFKIGMIYVFAVFLTYFLFGLGLTAFMARIPLVWAEYISISVGLLIVIAGILEIKDYFWYGQGVRLRIPNMYVEKIKENVQKLGVGTVAFFGVFVASVEFPCTGGPYLAVTLLLAQNFDLGAFLLLVLYNIIFVIPLVIILLLVMLRVKIQNIQRWRQGNKAYIRYATGLVLIALGWLLMLIASGVVNLN